MDRAQHGTALRVVLARADLSSLARGNRALGRLADVRSEELAAWLERTATVPELGRAVHCKDRVQLRVQFGGW